MKRNRILSLCVVSLIAVCGLLFAQTPEPAAPSTGLDPLQGAEQKHVCWGPERCMEICVEHGCTGTGACGTTSGTCVCECG